MSLLERAEAAAQEVRDEEAERIRANRAKREEQVREVYEAIFEEAPAKAGRERIDGDYWTIASEGDGGMKFALGASPIQNYGKYISYTLLPVLVCEDCGREHVPGEGRYGPTVSRHVYKDPADDPGWSGNDPIKRLGEILARERRTWRHKCTEGAFAAAWSGVRTAAHELRTSEYDILARMNAGEGAR